MQEREDEDESGNKDAAEGCDGMIVPFVNPKASLVGRQLRSGIIARHPMPIPDWQSAEHNFNTIFEIKL